VSNDPSSWLNASLLKPRTPKRLNAWVHVRMRTAEDQEAGAVLIDFSGLGFGIESERQLLIGSELELLLPHFGWTKGKVQWALGSRMGGRFIDELSEERLADLQATPE
jgi:hypothetical protein